MWLERKAEDSETNVENETPRPSVNTGAEEGNEHLGAHALRGEREHVRWRDPSRRHLHKSKEIFQKGKNLQGWDRQERRQ